MVNVALLSFELFLLWLATLKSILQPSKMPVPSTGRRAPFVWPRRSDGTWVRLSFEWRCISRLLRRVRRKRAKAMQN